MKNFTSNRDKLLNRFFNKVFIPFDATDEDCWEWKSLINNKGYGIIRMSIPKRCMKVATHVAWFLFKGRWPELNVLHKCDCPSCVNPSHLFEGTCKDNTQDMIQKGRDKVMGRGTNNHRAKLSNKDINAILKLIQERELQHYKIAEKFNVSPKTISNIKLKRTWNHLIPSPI